MDGDSNILSFTSSSLPPSNSIISAQEENSIIPLDQIVGGGPPRDGIPSIDSIKFVSVQELFS